MSRYVPFRMKEIVSCDLTCVKFSSPCGLKCQSTVVMADTSPRFLQEMQPSTKGSPCTASVSESTSEQPPRHSRTTRVDRAKKRYCGPEYFSSLTDSIHFTVKKKNPSIHSLSRVCRRLSQLTASGVRTELVDSQSQGTYRQPTIHCHIPTYGQFKSLQLAFQACFWNAGGNGKRPLGNSVALLPIFTTSCQASDETGEQFYFISILPSAG